MDLFSAFNIKAQCQAYRVGLWSCPRFLFVIMGGIIVLAMISTNVIATRYADDPRIASLLVIMVTALLFVIGHFVISSFERLAEASRAQVEFISIISHQLRSPLSAVKWQLELLESKAKEADGMVADSLLKDVHMENERVIKIVDMLLEVNRIDREQISVRREKVSLRDVTRRIINNYSTFANALHVKISMEESVGDSVFVMADSIKLPWVIENLLSNALHYSHKDGNVVVRTKLAGSDARWEVQDDGVGIPKRDQKKVFQKFFRADNVVGLDTHGSGLGLFIVKAFTQAMGGSVGFTSQEARGSTFWFTLPLAK